MKPKPIIWFNFQSHTSYLLLNTDDLWQAVGERQIDMDFIGIFSTNTYTLRGLSISKYTHWISWRNDETC